MLKALFGSLLKPPAFPLLLVLAGLLAMRRYPRWGRPLAWAGLALAYLCSTVMGAMLLNAPLEQGQRALDSAHLRALMQGADPPQAVVILGGGTRHAVVERPYAETPKLITLERLVHGAWVASETGLPVAVTGGPPRDGMSSEAEVMKRVLEERLATPVRWAESDARDTADNARFTVDLLRRDGIERVLLVTQAYHMPRAAASFRTAGLQVIPAPHGFVGPFTEWGVATFTPTVGSAELVSRAAHEWIGMAWYWMRGNIEDARAQ